MAPHKAEQQRHERLMNGCLKEESIDDEVIKYNLVEIFEDTDDDGKENDQPKRKKGVPKASKTLLKPKVRECRKSMECRKMEQLIRESINLDPM